MSVLEKSKTTTIFSLGNWGIERITLETENRYILSRKNQIETTKLTLTNDELIELKTIIDKILKG